MVKVYKYKRVWVEWNYYEPDTKEAIKMVSSNKDTVLKFNKFSEGMAKVCAYKAYKSLSTIGKAFLSRKYDDPLVILLNNKRKITL